MIDSFASNDTQRAGAFQLQRDRTYVGRIGSVHIRVSADLRVLEGAVPRYIFYKNWTRQALPGRLAEETLQVAYWALEQNGIDLPLESLEYIDLFNGSVQRSHDTLRLLNENARAINELWSDL